MSISLYELFLVSIIGQCIFLIFAIQYIPKKHTGANRIIQYLLVIYCVFLFERALGHEFDIDFLRRYSNFINTLYLLIGPFVYTYIRRLFFYKNGNYQLAYYHYLPALFYVGYCFLHIYYYDSIKDYKSYFNTLLFWNDIIFFISISAYLFISNRLLNYYKKNEEQELSFNQTIIKYVEIMLICLWVYMIFWLLGIIERFVIKLPIDIRMIWDISCLIFGIQIYIVGFYNLKHPEVFKIRFPSKNGDMSKRKNKLDENEISKIQNLVDVFFKEEKGYRRPELSLAILANEINTTTNKLSWVLNNIYKKTFYELVNEYRVEDFSQRINENAHKEFTLISIAYEVGFNSKSTFYKAFKEVKKITPSEYIKQVENL
ncbi:helix-turn-helix domain-containing protein [Leptobacterium flavescens]|uniref:Helix-turn-helix domain-containing protein n=1 Tax=Leptobacterium flavescens TaxID=472055 RepID=A0A6P0UM25_9FLAO|nr:helix-turn-helix domain-containing protein [Leptobacterium flavescens]NER12113.1 helix-turn-helix domain-containing protein [Leptobacterium flavescens]